MVAIVPFLNEEHCLPGLLGSIDEQTRRPDHLVLVDDGSTDNSLGVAKEFSEGRPWVSVHRRPPRPPQRDRLAAANELRAFEWAVARLEPGWDVVGKLDADLELSAQTLACLERAFEEDSQLGLAGTFLREADPTGTLVRLEIRPEHVHGATKFYRRACYEQIAPLPDYLGWDMIDEVRARMHGWRTQSFAVPNGDPLHIRPRGAYDGLARGFRRWGMGAWATGEHPLHVVLHSILRMRERPRVLGGACYLYGWVLAGLRRLPRAEPELRAQVRRDQLQRIRARAWDTLLRRPSAQRGPA